jgi:RNA polymerase sigma-70 factor (ECF subfamily)
VQGLFARLLGNHGLAIAEAGRGRFRSWLLAVFRHHLVDLHAHATAARRDRDLLLWIDALDAEARLAVGPAAPEAAYAAPAAPLALGLAASSASCGGRPLRRA